ncbi:hypothetical protein PHET_02832 [Paragonimus heterotremus]|uniref:DUF3677 domain-containing protein n=1 Tax=Paragonimus heterotremus TaxID=100268 RepID=A0A8J4TF90_9TREM|nr:hypothetical protein PHET_02832 [Paragonimus heterotremus]
MRGVKRTAAPAGALISLGTKTKRATPSPSYPHGGLTKKTKADFVEVEAGELVRRTESALSSGNMALAESLVLSALNQVRANCGPPFGSSMSSSVSGLRISGASGSRLIAGFSIGLLVLAQAHPSLFGRITVLDQLMALLGMSPRELGISLPPGAVATISARARGLHVLVANLIYFALEGQTKWPSHLVKLYLEDCLSDRVWVDQDECRLFVLNLETAFPKAFGDPRGLFTVLSNPPSVGAACTSGTISNHPPTTSNAVYYVIGLSNTSQSTRTDLSASKSHDEIAEAVSTVVRTQATSVAKIVHGPDFITSVVPRFEACRQAIEVIIVNTLREAMGRRAAGSGVSSNSSSSTGGASGLANSATVGASPSAVSGGSAGGGGSSVGVSNVSGAGSSGDITQLRNLIRTVGMAVGLPEIRGLVTTRLEPWLTNPKLQLFSIGLTALLATNCRLGGLSPHDLDLMVSMIYRIRYKLLKPNIQSAFFESISHMVKAAPTNLYTIINLCAASELRPAQASDVIEAKNQPSQHVSQSVLRIAEAVRIMTQRDEPTAESASTPASHGQQPSPLNSATMAAVAAGAATAASRASASAYFILPFLFQRFPTQWVRLMGTVLHERLLLSATSCLMPRDRSPLSEDQLITESQNSLSSVYQFLRELSRNWRSNLGDPIGSSSSSSISPQFGPQSFLPCAELAGALLQDRSHRGNTTVSMAANTIVNSLVASQDGSESKGHIAAFQSYLVGLVSLICALQMLSASRPYLNAVPTARRTSNHNEAMKAHQLASRQIRLAFLRWTKTILPPIVNAAVQSSTSSEATVNTVVIACFEALKPASLIRRALMLQSVHPLHRPEATTYELLPCYPTRLIWSGDQDQSPLTRLVTDVCLPEKLAHQLLILGLEPSWQLLNPLEAVDMVCELVWRAASLARDSGLETLSVTKAEQLVDLMYASCAYISEQQLPPEMLQLAYAPVYWKVSITAVILAAHCLQTCGLHLWTNYPTIRRLMEMVITGEFSCSDQNSYVGRDASAFESERLNAEMELQLIIRLETMLLNANSKDSSSPTVVVSPETSKLVGRLVRNNPRGPCRLPPLDQLNLFRFVSESLGLGRRLWRSRDPDFLLELIRHQTSRATVQPWLVRLVESSDVEFELLPVQCLCEYLLCDAISRQQTVHEDMLPSLMEHTVALDEWKWSKIRADLLVPFEKPPNGDASNNDQHSWRLVHKLREDIRSFSSESTSDALVRCFFTRLSDQRCVVRRAVRQCLHILASSESTQHHTMQPDPVCSWLQVLRCLKHLPALRCQPVTLQTDCGVPSEPFHHLLSAILASLLVENDLDILTAYIIFICQTTTDLGFITWRPVITGLTDFILSRQSCTLHNLLHRQTKIISDSSCLSSAYAALEALADIFLRYVEYNCTAAEAIPVDENKSVFVSWSADRQCPLELDCIQAQLILLTHTHPQLPAQQTRELVELFADDFPSDQPEGVSSWLRLRDAWFIPEADRFRLPDLSPFVFPMPSFTTSDNLGACHLTFACSTVGASPTPCLSTELRCRLIYTNHYPLLSGALWLITMPELVALVSQIRVFLLTPNSVRALIEQLNGCLPKCDSRQRDLVQSAVRRLEKRNNSMDTNTLQKPTPTKSPSLNDLRVSRSLRNDASISRQPGFPDHTKGSFWSQLLSTFGSLSCSQHFEVICEALHMLTRDSAVAVAWLDQLDQELVPFQPSPRTTRIRANTRKSPMKLQVVPTHCDSSFFHTLDGHASWIDFLAPLVSVCMFSEPEPKSVSTRFVVRLETTLAHSTDLSPEVRQIVGRLMTHVCTLPSSLVCPQSGSLGSPPVLTQQTTEVTLPEHSLKTPCSLGSVLDLVSLYGLADLPTDTSFSLAMDTNVSVVSNCLQHSLCRCIFACPNNSHDPVVMHADASCFLLTELVDQANPMFLRDCVAYLLQLDNTELINPTRVLDFLTAVLTLPRLSYPVPRSEPRDRPDASIALSELAKLTLVEACHLINYVLNEADHHVAQYQGAFDHSNYSTLDRCLIKRTPLLDLAVTHWPNYSVLYLECIAGFVPWDAFEKLEARICPSEIHTPRWPLISGRLLIHLYLRWPGIVGLMHSSADKTLILHSTCTKLPPSLICGTFLIPQPEIDRLGPLILVGLTASNETVAETAQLASKAFAVHHPRPFLRLLPVLSALSDGRLDLSWSQFSARKYHVLFDQFLHLLELLTFPADANSESAAMVRVDEHSRAVLFSEEAKPYGNVVDQLLANLISMLARFYAPSRRLSGLACRLARLLEVYGRDAPWLQGPDRASGLRSANQGVLEELELLGSEFDEFGPVLDLLSSNPRTGPKPEQDCSVAGGFLPLSSDSLSKASRRWTLATVLPFVQQLKMSTDTRVILPILEDLDDASKRRIETLFYFKTELESLISHPDKDVCTLAVRLLMRLLDYCPKLAPDVIESAVIPLLSPKLSEQGVLNSTLLAVLPNMCLLAPQVAPRLLETCAEYVLLGLVSEVNENLVSAVEESVRRLTLEGLDNAVIDHAASALLTRSNLVRGS